MYVRLHGRGFYHPHKMDEPIKARGKFELVAPIHLAPLTISSLAYHE
jgi:hypothetical protein